MPLNERLKAARESRGLTQEGLGAICAVSKRSQQNYETGKRSPDAEYFMALHSAGFDVKYVLTGEPDSQQLSTDEIFLLDKFRQADKRKQQMVLGMLIMDDDSIPLAVAGELGKGKGSQVGKNSIGNISDSKVGDITQK